MTGIIVITNGILSINAERMADTQIISIIIVTKSLDIPHIPFAMNSTNSKSLTPFITINIAIKNAKVDQSISLSTLSILILLPVNNMSILTPIRAGIAGGLPKGSSGVKSIITMVSAIKTLYKSLLLTGW